MKIKLLIIFAISLILLSAEDHLAFAKSYTQMDGLFSVDVPETWHWAEDPQHVIITYPDGKTVAIQIDLVPSRSLSDADIKKLLKDSNDTMVKEGVEAHQGVVIDNKEIRLDGVYAKQLDFKTAPPNSMSITYISLFNKGYSMTITYGTADDKMRMMMDDMVATLKFK